jgi:hypothetical protein
LTINYKEIPELYKGMESLRWVGLKPATGTISKTYTLRTF